MRLSDIASATRGQLAGSDAQVLGVSIDTRTLEPGDTFVALRGPNFDGHDYIKIAESRGAIATIVQERIGGESGSQILVADTHRALTQMAVLARNEFNGKVAAITGSCGKTTVKGMLNAICSLAGGCIATKGNLNNLIGVPLSLLRLNNENKFGVFEAGASVEGEISALAEIIRADVAVITNVMPAHVEGFGSVDNIAKEKTDLFQALDSKGCAVINLDDPRAAYFVERSSHVSKFGFSLADHFSGHASVENWVAAKDISMNASGCASFELCWPDEGESCQLAVFGKHNVANALAASAVASCLGVPRNTILEGLQSYEGEKRRMQVLAGKKGERIIDDSYNANPGSVMAAINYLSAFDHSILVMGDMAELGKGAETAHRDIGEYARNAGVKSLFATGTLAAEAVSAYGAGGFWFESQSELLEKLKEYICSNSAVLVKGSRSARMENIVDALLPEEGEQ